MKRIAVFSDIHGNYQALKSILNDINKEIFDDVICLGDVVGIGPDSIKCLNEIISSNIKMVLGNHELYQIKKFNIDNLSREKKHESFINSMLSDKHKDFLNSCPLSYEFLEKGHLFTFSHFLIKDNTDNNYPFYSTKVLNDSRINSILNNCLSDYLFLGHIHDNFTIHKDNSLFVCVGSSGCVKGNTTYYTMIEILDNCVNIKRKYITYDRKKFEKSLNSKDYPNKEQAKSFFGINLDE